MKSCSGLLQNANRKGMGNYYYIYFLVHFWSEILDALEKVK